MDVRAYIRKEYEAADVNALAGLPDTEHGHVEALAFEEELRRTRKLQDGHQNVNTVMEEHPYYLAGVINGLQFRGRLIQAAQKRQNTLKQKGRSPS